jgi:hypothetical protein
MPISDAGGRCETNNVFHGRGEAYDNNLVKDNCWKEIAGEWQGSNRVTAWYMWIGLNSYRDFVNVGLDRHERCSTDIRCCADVMSANSPITEEYPVSVLMYTLWAGLWTPCTRTAWSWTCCTSVFKLIQKVGCRLFVISISESDKTRWYF